MTKDQPDLRYNGSLKLLRETLCNAQMSMQRVDATGIIKWWYVDRQCARLQELINEIDRHRPLGPDGKHGDLHTDSCGCEDK